MTPRTLYNWEHRPPGRPGRPRRPETLVREAREACRRELERQGYSAGWRPVQAALGDEYSVALVQAMVAGLKAEHRAQQAREARARRCSFTVHGADVMWSLDETHLGRLAGGEASVALLLRDVASTKTIGGSVGPEATGEDLVAQLELARAERGRLPLVVAHDGGPAQRSQVFADYLARHRVVALRNRPHTPQHNPWIERGNADLKAETGLGRGVLIHDEHATANHVTQALRRLDGARLRASRGMRTADVVDAGLPRVYTELDRARLHEAACAARDQAVLDADCPSDRYMAAREAVLETLARFGYITRSRGGVPLPTPNRKYFPYHHTGGQQ